MEITEVSDHNSTYSDCQKYPQFIQCYFPHINTDVDVNQLSWNKILFMLLFAAVFVLGTIDNLLVCLVIWKNKHMRNVTNVFILNLAISDLLVLLLALLPTMIQDIYHAWYLGNVGCKGILFLQRVSVIVSILTLIAISVERYYAICYPLKVKATPTRVILIIITIWFIAMAFSCPELYFGSWSLETSWMCYHPDPNIIYFYFFIVAFYILPFLVMTFVYVLIGHSLWISHLDQLSATGSDPTCGSKGVLSQLIQRRRAARMLIVVVICFFLCYLLHFILVMASFHANFEKWNKKILMALITTGHLLIYVNSALNPVIYNFMSEKFRTEFRTLCGCCKLCKLPVAEQTRLSSWRTRSDRVEREETKATHF